MFIVLISISQMAFTSFNIVSNNFVWAPEASPLSTLFEMSIVQYFLLLAIFVLPHRSYAANAAIRLSFFSGCPPTSIESLCSSIDHYSCMLLQFLRYGFILSLSVSQSFNLSHRAPIKGE